MNPWKIYIHYNVYFLPKLSFVAIFVASKPSSGDVVNTKFIALANTSSSCGPMPQIRYTPPKTSRCVEQDGEIFCCGGRLTGTATKASKKCWKYTFATNAWTTLASMPMDENRFGGEFTKMGDGRIWYTGKWNIDTIHHILF